MEPTPRPQRPTLDPSAGRGKSRGWFFEDGKTATSYHGYDREARLAGKASVSCCGSSTRTSLVADIASTPRTTLSRGDRLVKLLERAAESDIKREAASCRFELTVSRPDRQEQDGGMVARAFNC